MTTISTLVNAAFRESGITAVGTLPDANESAEATTLLINYIASLYNDEIGEFLIPYNVGTNGITYSPSSDQQYSTVIKTESRLVCNLSGPMTLYFPPVPQDGSIIAVVDSLGNFATNPLTLNGNGRMINGSPTAVLNTNNANITYLFDGTTSAWSTIVLPASGSDSSPFNTKYDDMLIIWLAMRINPRYGADTHPETVAVFNRLNKQFKRRYNHNEEVHSEYGIVWLPSHPLRGIWDIDTFNRG